MIPVDAPYAPWFLGAVLVALVAVLAWRAGTKDRREFRRFKRLRSTKLRQKTMRKWLLESLAWFGGSALIVLVLVWQFVPPMVEQVYAWPLVAGVRHAAESSDLVFGLLVGGAMGLLAAVILAVFLGRNAKEVPTIGDIHALLPRTRAELKYGWALSINAGIVEELLLRLALPTLIFAVFGNALVAVVASLLVFAAMHAYQGIAGVVGSFVVGAVLMAIFLTTGSILWAILAHALFDLRSLVLIPVVVYQVHLPESERRPKKEEAEPVEAKTDQATQANTRPQGTAR